MEDQHSSNTSAQGGGMDVGGDAETVQGATVGRDVGGSVIGTQYNYHGAPPERVLDGSKPVRPWRQWLLALAGATLLSIGLAGGLFVGSRWSDGSAPSAAAGSQTSEAGAAAPTTTAAPSPAVALVAVSFVANDYNPRLVDLRTAGSSGLPLSSGDTLRLSDIGVAAPVDAPDQTVSAEIYAGTDIIAWTDTMPIRAGVGYLPDLEVEEVYRGPDNKHSFTVLPNWREISLVLVTYDQAGQVTGRLRTPIRLDPAGTAWLRDPPDPHITAVIYSVNDGPRLMLDLRGGGGSSDETRGINASPGDTLTLQEVWYYAETTGVKRAIRVEARLGRLFNPETTQRSQEDLIRKGHAQVGAFEPMLWTVPEGETELLIHILRDDEALLDILIVPLDNQGAPGLAPLGAVDALPGQTWLSFEDGAMSGWSVGEPAAATLDVTTEVAHSGAHALRLNTFIVSKENPATVTANLGSLAPRGGIALRMYLPQGAPSDGQIWANLYTKEGDGYRGSPARALRPGQWVTLVWAAEDVQWEGDAVVGVQVGINNAPYQGPIYVDDVQLFHQ